MLRSDHYCKIKRCTCIVFHRNWESSLILTNENRTTTSLIFSSSDASRRERHQRTSRQTREREILVYTERKRTSEWEGGGKRKRETEYECVCTIAVRDPLAFQNRFLAVVTRNAVTPSKYSLDRHQKYESVERQFCITRCVVVSLGWTSREGTPEADRSSHHLWRLIPEEGFSDRINDVCLHRNFPSLSRRDQVKEKIVP